MLIVHIRFIVFMAAQTAKNFVVGCIAMTIGTTGPCSFMPSGINWKGYNIMLSKTCWFPAGICCVAFRTVIRKLQCRVCWIGGIVIIGLVTRKTIIGGIRVIAVYMTFGTIVNIMPLGKRKTTVIKNCRFPTRGS
jgi:hypothetical protein